LEKSYKEYLQYITAFIFDVDGVLTDGTVIVNTDGEMLRNMSIKDGFALKTAIDKGYHVCIISGGTNEGVRKRLEGLGVKEVHLGTNFKMATLDNFFKSNGLQPENVLYMGDDLPDYSVMLKVGLPCCPQDAVPEIKHISKYVSHKKGGDGCVRDVIEQVLKVQGKWFQGGDADAKEG
jgi:3-deoxy-D-manno-octulosonate 8-phosphate phosphatase (KDO 8-P phosphatase)